MVRRLDASDRGPAAVAALKDSFMRYCIQCRQLTAGSPLFCTFCGRTYDVRLCPRLHPNPRIAEVCTECGSRDLSHPQPPASLLSRLAMTGLALLPGGVLIVVSVLVLIAFVHAVLTNEQVQGQLVGMLFFLGVIWFVYTRLPRPIQNLTRRGLRRGRRDRRDRRDG